MARLRLAPRIQDTAKGPPVGMGGCRLRWHGKPGLIVISITPDRTGLSTRRWQGIRSGLRAAGSGVGLHVGCCVVISAVSGVEGFPGSRPPQSRRPARRSSPDYRHQQAELPHKGTHKNEALSPVR